MKDPAFLFYPGDWTGGTLLLNRHQKGCYIDLLVAQYNNGPLLLEEIKTILGSDFGQWNYLSKKFASMDGRYYNVRLDEEMKKRSKFTSSRRNNASSKAYAIATDQHMEDRDENSIYKSIKYLKEIPEKELEELYHTYKASKSEIKTKAEKLYLWCETNGKTKKNYRMFLLGRLLEDFGKRPPPEVKPEILEGGKGIPADIKNAARAITNQFLKK